MYMCTYVTLLRSYVVLRSSNSSTTATTFNSTTTATLYYCVGDHTIVGGGRNTGTYITMYT